MGTLIKLLRNGGTVNFDTGKFDSWCVFLAIPGRVRYAPTDNEYFTILSRLGAKHGHEKLYTDFVKIYSLTGKYIDRQVLKLIDEIADGYAEEAEQIEIWFTVIYGGMIAEENKKYAVLKKRVKRLGIHQVLVDRLEPQYAAKFSRGRKWQELDSNMKPLGF